MASVNEIMQLCRLCLVKEEVNVPIFEEQGDLRQIFLKISACLPVKVSREDNLPKSICDGCSCKLEMFYQFWNTSTNSEKKLIKWLNQGGIDKPADKTSQHSMNIDPMILKQEVIEVADNQSSPDDLVPDDLNVSNDAQDYILQQQQLPYQNVEFQFQQDGFEETTTDEVATTVETEAPPTRKRRAAAMRALANMESEDEDDVDLIDTKIAKTEEQSDDSVGEDPEPTTFVGLPSATDNEQPGPSGVGKTPGDAPCSYGSDNVYSSNFENSEDLTLSTKYLMTLANSKPSLSDVEDQLNDTDRELLNLLATEDDCSDILRNIASNANFENLINDETAFEADSVIASLTGIAEVLVTDKKEKKIGTFKCDHCGKMCTTKKLLKYHLMSHFGIREHSCEICGKTFKHKYEVSEHKLSHSKPNFQCDVCSKMFIHKSHLTAHLRKHNGDFIAFCPECGKGFHTQASCKYHLNNHHKMLQHVCDKCGARLSSNSALKEHFLTHQPNYGENRSHICDLCGKTYLNGRNLRNHMKSHMNEKNHCHVCGKSLSSKKGLQVHLKMHMGDKSFICGFCNKGFTSKEYLVVHQRTHTGDRPFRCETCGKCFTQKTSLNVHIRSHTGERPYKCHCGKSFITKTHLAAHNKTHETTNIDFAYVPQMLM